MEKVASTVMFPCKFSTSGCEHLFHHTEKAEHEEICQHRLYSCPCPGVSCNWQGSLDEVMNHLMRSHKSITTLQGKSNSIQIFKIILSSFLFLTSLPVNKTINFYCIICNF